MIFVGIDCGRLGAIGWMNGERRDIQVHDTPLTSAKDYDVRAAWELVRDACWNGAAESTVVIEDTISVPHKAKDGQLYIPASDKALHESLGIWLGICAAWALPVILVHPKTWKASMLAGVANDRFAEALVLKQRFAGKLDPSVVHGPQGGLRDGRVDALFLAEYGRMQHRFKGLAA